MSLHVDVRGEGPDLVLLHGWGFHGGAWSGVASRLAPRFRLHLVDLPGHGRSGDVAFHDLDSLAEAIEPAIPEGARVAGWSLGGLAALRIAARRSVRVSALGLVSATPSFVRRGGWTAGLEPHGLEEFIARFDADPAEAVRAFLQLNAKGASGARALVRELEAVRASAPEATRRGLRAGLEVLSQADLRDTPGRIDMPCLLVHGLADELVPPEASRRLADAVRQARLVEVEGAPHAVPVSHAAEVARALDSIDG